MKYELDLTAQFEEDVQRHRTSGNKVAVEKINTLLNELRVHPKTGTGKPEPLKGNKTGKMSRRITGKHRLVYQIKEEVVTVIALSGWGHYGDK